MGRTPKSQLGADDDLPDLARLDAELQQGHDERMEILRDATDKNAEMRRRQMELAGEIGDLQMEFGRYLDDRTSFSDTVYRSLGVPSKAGADASSGQGDIAEGEVVDNAGRRVGGGGQRTGQETGPALNDDASVAADRLMYADIAHLLPLEARTRLERTIADARRGNIPASTKKYAPAFREMLGINPRVLESEISAARKRLVDYMTRLGFQITDFNPFSLSKSWAAFDIAKQFYLNRNPEESSSAYRLANPLEDQRVRDEIVFRHLGWELYQKWKNPKFKQVIEQHLGADPLSAQARSLLEKQPKSNNDLSSNDLAKLGEFFAQILDDLETGDAELGDVQKETRGGISSAFERAAKAQKDPESAKGLHELIVHRARRLVELTSHRSERVRQYVRRDLDSEVAREHDAHIAGRRDLGAKQREALGTSEGRLRFRIEAFNILCTRGEFDLRARDEVLPPISEAEFEEHARKTLKSSFDVFDRACSRFDAGGVARSLKTVAHEIAEHEELPETADLGAKRAKLMDRIGDRVGRDLQSGYGTVKERKFMTKFLDHGGAFAAKAGAAAILLANPELWLLSAGMWATPAIARAVGLDFGKIVGSVVKAPFRGVRAGAKALIRVLPNSVRDRMPERMVDWADEVASPNFEKSGRASLPFETRAKIFWRNVMPAPWAVEKLRGLDSGPAAPPARGKLAKVGRFTGDAVSLIGKMVPSAQPNVGESIAEQNAASSRKMNKACDEALANLLKS